MGKGVWRDFKWVDREEEVLAADDQDFPNLNCLNQLFRNCCRCCLLMNWCLIRFQSCWEFQILQRMDQVLCVVGMGLADRQPHCVGEVFCPLLPGHMLIPWSLKQHNMGPCNDWLSSFWWIQFSQVDYFTERKLSVYKIWYIIKVFLNEPLRYILSKLIGFFLNLLSSVNCDQTVRYTQRKLFDWVAQQIVVNFFQ